jgi:predicted acylesterase/phospholipase RssA
MRARELEQCDLVMKGGITSGVVYPRAVMVLGERYRFRNIGGTSAGAIAAAVAAAAEYGRQTGATEDLARIEKLVDDLKQRDFLLGLFQPTPENRPLWEVARATTEPGSVWSRIERAVVAMLHARRTTALIGFVCLLALVVLAGVGFATLDVSTAVLVAVIAVLLAVFVGVVTVAIAALGLGRAGYEAIRNTGFGFCPGVRQEGREQPGLTDWLHGHIQACAGLGIDDPLTFRKLEAEDVQVALEMLTTDLSYARPLRCRRDLAGYSFIAPEFLAFLPEPVVRHMAAVADGVPFDEADLETRRLRPMPVDDLPVLTAVRLSLSFPGLLSAVPLYRDGARHLFSDGGISSNFPIHFFDAWFTSRPTFGLDLAEYPNTPGAPFVFLPTDPEEPTAPRWSDVRGLVDFLVRIKDAMQNWRDSTQAELPGYRERICQIRLTRDQGGLNLDMDPKTIARLIERGEEAGRKLLDEFRFEEHRWIRFLTAMRLLEPGLQDVAAKYDDFDVELGAGMPAARSFRQAYPADWCPPAAEATLKLLAVAGEWGPPPKKQFTFDREGGPTPRAVMRIGPEC